MSKLAKYLIPILVAVILLVVLATGSPIDVSASPGAVVTINAPGAVALGTLPYSGTAKQVVAHGTDGSVNVTGIVGGETYSLRVTGSPIRLTSGANTLNNALMIATGQAGGPQLGDVTQAAALSSGDWVDPTTKVVALTGAAQDIETGLTAASVVLKLTAFQKIDANEDHPGGTYQLTLTYTSEVSPL